MNQDYNTNGSNQRVLLNQYDQLSQYHQHPLAHLHLLLPPSATQSVVGSTNNQYQQTLNYAAVQSIAKKDQSQPIANSTNGNYSPIATNKKFNPISTKNAQQGQQQQPIVPSSFYPNSNTNLVQSYPNHYGYQQLANQFSQYTNIQQDLNSNNSSSLTHQNQQLNNYENNLIKSYENLKSTSSSPSTKLSKLIVFISILFL
jgi:hypothetical protein